MNLLNKKLGGLIGEMTHIKRKKEIILAGGLLFLGLYLLVNSVSAQPVVTGVTITPEHPTPMSTITFNVNVTGENITGVYLNVRECKGDFCYAQGFNESMDMVASGEYQKEITLKHSDADNIEYWFVINSNGTWYDLQKDQTITYLSTSSGEINNGSSGKNGSNGTPGFEIVLLLFSIVLLIFILKRKRM